ncbi:MAG TPA: hypothetical protein VFT47_10070 [Vicinamibacterales bacterium]|nr:hypothetical protein [Vicinamibacterales bacterium]
MTPPPVLAAALEWWSSLYSNHATVRTAVSFAHIGGLLGGGGCAIAADRATLLLPRDDAAARLVLIDAIRRAHRVVLGGLLLLFVSGVLLLGADVETYIASRVFWLKMALVGALLVNGALLVRAERRVAGLETTHWRRLRRASLASLALWLLTTLLGAALPNIG